MLCVVCLLYRSGSSHVEGAAWPQGGDSSLGGAHRREHDKAVLQAQQVLLQAERERERLTQCAELEKARLREELDIATKKLHSIEAERNLLMVRAGVF